MSGKYALIIGNTEYIDPGLAQLSAPGKDAEDFARVLKDQEIGAFDDVRILINQLSSTVSESIDEFFDQKKLDDLLVLYFSGHGVRDELGSLYLAVKNTIRSRLRSTAIKSDYIREAMDQSRSRRQVLILDCCNSGAFAQGTKAATGGSIGTASAFEGGYGRIILTASDSTQFAWEGDTVIGETDNSLFTHYLVEGLKGEADQDGDGRITVDEVYDYAYEKVKLATPKQTPSKFSTKQQGEIILRQSTRIEDIKPMPLPVELIDEIEDTRPYVREAAVQKLERILKGKSLGLARSAREALEKIASNDDSRRVSQAATQVLASIQQAEQLAVQKEAGELKLSKEDEAKRITQQKSEAQRLSNERVIEAERQEKEKAEKFAAKEAKQKAEELAEKIAQQKAEEELIAKAQLEAKHLAEEKRRADEKTKAERKARIITNIQSFLNIFKSVFPKPEGKKLRVGYLAIGAATLLLIVWVSLPQLIFLSSNSVSEQPNPIATQSIKIKSVDYGASHLLLNGMAIEIEIKTNGSVKDRVCQVIVFFKDPDNDLLTAPRSFTTIISPYISEGNFVSVYTNIKPSYNNATFNVNLFMPYTAFANIGLLEGKSSIRFYSELHIKGNSNPIVRSSSFQFVYTK